MSVERNTLERAAVRRAPLTRKLRGLLFFRLVLAIFFLLLTLLVQSHREESLLASHLRPFYFFSCALFLFTIVAALSLKWSRRLERFAAVQLCFDVCAVTVLIFLSGGVESPFSFLYMPVIISAALLLHRNGGLITASLCSVAYGVLLDFQYAEWIAPLQLSADRASAADSVAYLHSFLMSVAGFYLVAYLSGHLAEELQKSSQQVRDQKQDFHRLEVLHRNIVQSMHSGLLTISPGGEVLFSNQSALEILALSEEQLDGQPCHVILPALNGMDWSQTAGSSLQKLPSAAMGRQEMTYQRPSGEELCLGYTVSLLQKADGERSGWLIIFQDLTHLKAMEEHVKRVERLALAGRIAAEIAHEIKNPLASMSGAVQMLELESRTDSTQSRLMNIVHREIDRINELVTDFLWLSKGSRKSERVQDVPVCSVIQDILSLLKSQEKASARHRIKTRFEKNLSCAMDPDHFRQVLWNVLTNALEAMPEGGDLSIRVDGGVSKGSPAVQTRIDIEDSGTGIPAEIRDRVFEPFFTTKQSGTGLGLSIVYQLMENAGGRVEWSCKRECGTTFSLIFPPTPSFSLAK